MRKSLMALLLSIIFMLTTTGCFAQPSDSNGTTNDTPGITTNKIPYTVIEEQALSQELKDIIEELTTTGGYRVINAESAGAEEEGSQYIIIALGIRPSGGYSVEIVSAEDVEGKISVVYREKMPKPEDIVTEAITYPYIVIKVALPLPVTVTQEEVIPSGENQGITTNKLPYTVIEEQALTQELKDIIEELKITGGYKAINAESAAAVVEGS